MKPIILIFALVLSACAPVLTKKDTALPPLASIIGHIKIGMSLSDVEKALSGHKPAVQFTQHPYSIWEVRERIQNQKDNSMNANRLVLVFNPEGKVNQMASSFCFLPDIAPRLSANPTTNCYQKQLFPFDKQVTYNAIKRLLIISNYQVDHSDAASELISATGTHEVEGNDDQMMFIKLSIVFSTQDKNSTEVVMAASFSTSEKQSTWVQAGFAGVTLPVPLPFQHTEEWIETGIVTPRFYLNFYDALSNLLAMEYLPYTQPLSMPITTAKQQTATPKPSMVKPENQAPVIQDSPSSTLNPTDLSEDETLKNLIGPIDAAVIKTKARIKQTSAILPIGDDADEAEETDNDIFSKLNGKPIDSTASKK